MFAPGGPSLSPAAILASCSRHRRLVDKVSIQSVICGPGNEMADRQGLKPNGTSTSKSRSRDSFPFLPALAAGLIVFGMMGVVPWVDPGSDERTITIPGGGFVYDRTLPMSGSSDVGIEVQVSDGSPVVVYLMNEEQFKRWDSGSSFSSLFESTGSRITTRFQATYASNYHLIIGHAASHENEDQAARVRVDGPRDANDLMFGGPMFAAGAVVLVVALWRKAKSAATDLGDG